MRHSLLLFAGLLLTTFAFASTSSPTVLVPRPVNVHLAKGEYVISEAGPKIKVLRVKSLDLPKDLPSHSVEGAYEIAVGKQGIRVKATAELGEFYAMQTIEQLCKGYDRISCCTITDYPRFAWRGLMFDISRYYLGPDFIRKQIDAMAALKMNVLHLHLSDDAGWRLQLQSVPDLTRKTAFRLGQTWEQWRDLGYCYVDEGNSAASGGYLTKAQARELVEYAQQKHITIIPEIDIPAHADPILTVFPELKCVGEDGHPIENTHQLCIGNPKTYEVLCSIFDEVMEVFPSYYVHIGGDEASHEPWEKCVRCREVSEDINLLQSKLVSRLAEYIASKGRRAIGWDESRSGNSPASLALMAWHNAADARSVAEAGFETVMVPNVNCYLDYCQDAPVKEPSPMGSYLPLDTVYAYNPLQGLTEEETSRVLGVQGNLWTEHVPSGDYAEYLVYPRALAIAEIGWGTAGADDFRQRAKQFCAESLDSYNCFDLNTEMGERDEYFASIDHLARGCSVTYNIPCSPRFTGSGAGTLTDGLMGGWSFETTRWNGFNSDMDVTIDLGQIRDISEVKATFMGNRSVWLAVPEKLTVLISDDGENFSEAAARKSEVNELQSSMVYYPISVSIGKRARYIRLIATRKSQPCADWIFTDEIIVK